MKILLINTYEQGGAATACIRLHKGLLKAGFDSKLLLRNYESSDLPETYRVYESNGKWRIKKIQQELIGNRNYKLPKTLSEYAPHFYFPQSAYDLSKHPLVQWADVINLHWVCDFLDYSFFYKVHKPIFWTLHDLFPFTGGQAYENILPKEKFTKWIQQNIKTKAKAYEHSYIEGIIVLNEWMKRLSSHSNLLDSFPHYLIPNGIDVSIFKVYNQAFARRIFDLPTDKKVLLFVADNTKDERKGFRHLLAALPLLEAQNTVLAVLGSRVHQLQEHENMIKLGRIEDERLMALAYAASDVFVIPSVEDNLPNTVVESLCCGTPVVGFHIGGIPDMVHDGENGFLADVIDSVQLASKIDQALTHVFDRTTIHLEAAKKYNQQRQATAYADLFAQSLPL